MKFKIIGTILALSGGIVALFSAIGFFFPGRLMEHFDYNRIVLGPEQAMTVLGIVLFIIALIVLILALFAFKHHYSKALFMTVIVLGIILFFFGCTLSGLLTLVGGILGMIGVMMSK